MNDEERDNYRWLTITNTMLRAMLGDEIYVHKWWLSPNRAFNELTPREQWEIDKDIVTKYVMNFRNR